VVNQTYQNLEVIIIDDHSSDSTPEIIKEYAQKDARIKPIFNSENIGPGNSRNLGLSKATGQYITLVDHDDWQDLTKYEKMMAKIEATNSDICFCLAEEYNHTTQKTKLMYAKGAIFGDNTTDIKSWSDRYALLTKSTPPPWLKIIRRELVTKHNIRFAENGNKFDDVLFHCLLSLFTNKVCTVDEVLYTHRYFPQSITAKSDIKKDAYFDIIKTWYDLEAYCLENNIAIKPVLIGYMHFFRTYVLFVHSRFKFYKEVRKIIKTYNLKKADMPDGLDKNYVSTWKLPKILRKSLLRIRIRPQIPEYRLEIFNYKILSYPRF
jgi:glycosyltransferase involved in cell wall biosynthesis